MKRNQRFWTESFEVVHGPLVWAMRGAWLKQIGRFTLIWVGLTVPLDFPSFSNSMPIWGMKTQSTISRILPRHLRFFSGWWWLEHFVFSHISWDCYHPNWRSHIFQRGRAGIGLNHQPDTVESFYADFFAPFLFVSHKSWSMLKWASQ